MTRRVRTIDAHVAGEPLRLIVDGCPQPRGRTMVAKQAWMRRSQDGLRRALVHEPRGHADMFAAMLTTPVSAGAHAGLLFMHRDGYSPMCGHGIIGAVTIALERGLLSLSSPSMEIVLDTPAGQVTALAECKDGRVPDVAFLNVPSFVWQAGVPIRLGGRTVPVDVAYGGAFYAIVDSEAAGVPVRAERLPELRRLGIEVRAQVESAVMPVHPLDPTVRGMYGTMITGVPERADSDLRNVTVFADGQIDRSPCGTGTAALMAVVDAMGMLGVDRPFTSESIIGTSFTGVVEERTTIGDLSAIVPRLRGTAWIIGEHLFLIDDDDPLGGGFSL